MTMLETPKFVLDYIQKLKNIFNTNPQELYKKYTIGDSKPLVVFEPYFESSLGWLVIHKIKESGKHLYTEVIEPIREIQTMSISGYQLVRPHKDPENTFRATSIEQMYSYTPDDASRKIVYSVGISPTNSIRTTKFKFRNNTVNTTLKFMFSVPSFLKINESSTVQLKPNQELIIDVILDEIVIKQKSLQSTKNFLEHFKWTVSPIEVTGPVYVKRNLPALKSVNASTREQSSISPSVITNVEYDTLKIDIDPSSFVLEQGRNRNIKVVALIGKGFGMRELVELQFDSNSIKWNSSNSDVEVNSSNASANATVTGIKVGESTITARIVKNPINITPDRWTQLVNGILQGTAKKIVREGRSVIEVTSDVIVLPMNESV